MAGAQRGRASLSAAVLCGFLAAALSFALRSDTSPVTVAGPLFPSNRLGSLPHVMVWAWERPGKLDFLDTREVGVAFLARTILLKGEGVVVRPRLQPLSTPPGTVLVAVVRIETHHSVEPTLSARQRAQTVLAISELSRVLGVAAVQVDFDAKSSERSFYRDLLIDLRRQLPDSTGLSITALASWCLSDSWLADSPVDEAVPMLFRMGPDRRQVNLDLSGAGDFTPASCRQSVGISTDEAVPKLPAGRRVYLFHPGTWSPDVLKSALAKTGSKP